MVLKNQKVCKIVNDMLDNNYYQKLQNFTKLTQAWPCKISIVLGHPSH